MPVHKPKIRLVLMNCRMRHSQSRIIVSVKETVISNFTYWSLSTMVYLQIHKVCLLFVEMCAICIFIGSGVVAYYDQRNYTIRHVRCLWTLPTSASGPRCKICIQYRNVLCSGLHRLLMQQQENMSDSSCDPSSHTKLCWLSHPQKDQQLQKIKQLYSKMLCFLL